MEEIILNTIQWSAPEYTHKEKSMDFLWTIGIVTVVACGLALWKSNSLFAIFIFISGCTLVLFSIRPPQEIGFSIETKGLSLGKVLHPWKDIKGFDIKKGEEYSKLMIQTSKYFLPIYTITFPTNIREEIKAELLKIIPAVEIEESRSVVFMEKLGF
jgi:hypothetical protein